MWRALAEQIIITQREWSMQSSYGMDLSLFLPTESDDAIRERVRRAFEHELARVLR